MKKIRLLTPIIGVVVCATPLLTTVSCGNNESEEEVVAFDENVERDYDIVADNDGREHEITLHDFKFKDDRETWGLQVEIINQSSSLTKLRVDERTSKEHPGLQIDEEKHTADVYIIADGIFSTEDITFDLKFTNKRGQEFISTGYSISAKIIFWPQEQIDDFYTNVCATIDGKDYFFDSYQLCDQYISQSKEPNYVEDVYGHKFKRSKFDGEIYLRNLRDARRRPIVIGQKGDNTYFGFLNDMPSFNSPVHVGDGVILSNYFLCRNAKFNSPIHFESKITLNFIPTVTPHFYFLSFNKEFNQPLDLSNLAGKTVRPEFENNYKGYILSGCENMVSEIKMNERFLISLMPAGKIDPLLFFKYSFAMNGRSDPAYKQGMNISCIDSLTSQMIRKFLPNIDGEDGVYRKLVITEMGK